MCYAYCSSSSFYILYVYIQIVFRFQLRDLIWKPRIFTLIASMCQAWLHFICLKKWLGLVYFSVHITIFSCSTNFWRDQLEHSNPLIYYKFWFIWCVILFIFLYLLTTALQTKWRSQKARVFKLILKRWG